MASKETANKISHAKTPSADEFLDLLFLDENGNILIKLTDVNRNIHNVTLIQHHKHTQNKTDMEVLQGIKDSLANIRERTLTNIEEYGLFFNA